MSKKPPSAREIAARVILRVLREDAFAAAVLDAELTRAVQLDRAERALATELAYGALRVWPWLEARVAREATAKKKIDPRVLVHLALAAYQLFFTTRVPAFAAVNEAVGAVRATQGPRVAAFANALLRKLAKAAAEGGPVDPGAALVEATPAWLLRALAASLGGDERARAYVRASLEPPPIGLRVQNANERDAWVERLRAAAPEGASIEAGAVSPLAVLVRGAGRPQALPGWDEGAWSIQEEGSQVVALALGAVEGDVVLDACAGRGNKTGLLARAVGAQGAVDAADLHANKLERLQEELARLHLRARATFAVDWSVGSGGVAGRLYDRTLVDAPCTGTGTMRRRPELALKRKLEDVAELARLQLAIVSRVCEHVKPGGTLVYAVCSVLREEGEGVVERLLAARADVSLLSKRLLVPMTDGTDGYFVAVLRKRSQENTT